MFGRIQKSEEKLSPLDELSDSISRMEDIVRKAKKTLAKVDNFQKMDSSKGINRNAVRRMSYKGNMYPPNPPRRQDQRARSMFIPFIKTIEDEFVELLRRTAEIVVRGERSAAKADNNAKGKNNGDADREDHHALFELFCERNVLSFVVNIFTGFAFATPPASEEGTPDGDDYEPKCTMLPPLCIATQAVQSISILIQNVPRATSLYFLLSNNRVNDLISFPLSLYDQAEELASEQKNDQDPKSLVPRKKPLKNYSSEVPELTTHFVNFLKCLAMRINSETLQFFLSYPVESNASGITASNPHFVSEHGAGAEELPDGARSLASAMEMEVNFPLYARALEFCGVDHDSFVRVTAMNICLNTLRLATSSTFVMKEREDGYVSGSETSSTTSSNDSDELEGGKTEVSANEKTVHPPHKAPDTAIHNVVLPIRDRLAIAHHVCSPSRVERLVSPIYCKLAEICGKLEESIKTLEDMGIPIDNALANKRDKMLSSVESIMLDLQDELLLLDDVLKVGLISLNEQAIELMLATFIYPLLLQPLLLYLHSTHDDHTSPPNTESNTNTNTSVHPFASSKNVSNSLLRSGLLNDDSPPAKESREYFATAQTPSDSYHPERSPPDPSPAKTAFFGLTAVFYTVTNRDLLFLLLTALVHPLGPDAKRGSVIRTKPNVVSLVQDKVCVRVDGTGTYEFGRGESATLGENGRPKTESEAGDNECFYILAPTLAHILDGTLGPKDTEKTRPNPYRRVLLECLAGRDTMSNLQQAAVFAVDAAISALKGSKGLESILFGGDGGKLQRCDSSDRVRDVVDNPVEDGVREGGRDLFFFFYAHVFGDDSSIPTHAVEIIESLCVGLMSASVAYFNGIWDLDYNAVAANALRNIALHHASVRETTVNLVEHRRRQSAFFITQLPSLLDSSGVERLNRRTSIGPKSIFDAQDEDTLDLMMDKIFLDYPQDTRGCVFDFFECRRSPVSDTESVSFWTKVVDHGTVEDAKDLSENLTRTLITASNKNAPMQCATSNVDAFLKLDAFLTLLKNTASDSPSTRPRFPDDEIPKKCPADSKSDDWADPTMMMISPIISSTLFKEQENGHGGSCPRPGSVVGLVGRAAFPCVCEVTRTSSSLFTDKHACVVAEGVKWQSLYLVLLGRHILLAEPEKGGSGGNGRVITSCLLSCLSVEKDKPLSTKNSSPARRLLLFHSSIKPLPPGVFMVKGDTSKNFCRSRMDLWFEDNTAADNAYEALHFRICKVRSKRGKQLREFFLQESA